jgi:Homeodomain-like domain
MKIQKKLDKKKLVVKLSTEDLKTLLGVIKHGQNNVRVVTRARILLLSHQGKTNVEIVEALNCAPRMICNVRQRFLKEETILQAIADADRPGQPKKVEVKHEAYVQALACTNPPKGHNHWTLPELKKKLLSKYKKLETISDERIRHMLLKSALKPWLKKNVVHT